MAFAALIGFYLLAALVIGSALMVVVSRNPVRSALYLVVALLTLAIYYITLSAQFIAAVQVIVYAGAIMVLFLFVIMLLNLGAPEALREHSTLQPRIAVLLGVLFLGALLGSQALLHLPYRAADPQTVANMGTVQSVGLSLYNPQLPWLFPFEITSILLLIAVTGAIIMAKRRI